MKQTLTKRRPGAISRTKQAPARTGLSRGGVLAVMLASTATIMVGSAITPAVPAIGAAYGLGDGAAWLVTLPAVGVVVSALPLSRLIARWGPYRVCALFLPLYALLGLAGPWMPTAGLLLASRFLLGVATAAVMSASTALISQFYGGEAQTRMVATQGMVIELGGVAFLSLAGVLTDLSWRGTFFIYAIALVAFLLLALFVRPAVRAGLPAEASAAESAAAEDKPARPVAPVLALAFLAMTVFFTCIVSIPGYFQGTLGYSASLSGYYLAGISLTAVCFAGLMPLALRRLGAAACLAIAFASFAAGHACLFLFTGVGPLILAVPLLGLGMGFSVPLINNLTVSRSSAAAKGRNLCLYSMAIFSGQIFSSVLAMASGGGRAPFALAALLALLPAAVLALRVRRRQAA